MTNFVRTALVAIAISCVAFSCDTYDDTEIRESIEDLKEGQLSVMEVEGVCYWGVGMNGETSLLLVGGKPVPVSVVPDLMISETGEWMISVDGGKTWVATGVMAQEESEPVLSEAKQEGEYLVLTLADGSVIKLVIVSEAVFEPAQNALYFAKEGLEKSVTLNAKNLKAYTITEKPEGWKARVDYNSDEDSYTLVVTSPADMSVAAQSGSVKILGTFTGGQVPEIVTVDVAFEKAFTLAAGVGEVVSVTVSENAFEDIDGYIIGAMKASEFSPEALVAWLNTEEGYLSEAQREAKDYTMSELVEGYNTSMAYIVYAVEHIPVKLMLSGMDSYTVEDLQTIQVGSSKVLISFSDIRYDSAQMSIEFNEMKGYFGGYAEKAFWESMGRDNVLESIKVGNMTALSPTPYAGPVSLFPDVLEDEELNPATDYVVWIMPESEEAGYEYKADDFIIYSFSSASVVEDASIAAPACSVSDVTYGGFTATVTPASGAYKTYAAIRKVSAVPEDLNQSVAELIAINNSSKGSAAFTISANSFEEADEVCLLAVSVTEDGRFGKVYMETVPLKKLIFSDEIGVQLSYKIHDLGDVTMSLSFTGSPSTISYYCTSSSYYGDDTMQAMLARGQIGDAVCDQQISKLLNGNTIEISGLTVGIQYTFYAIVKDASGVPSKLAKVSVTPIVVIDYIMNDAAGYDYGMPVITGSKVLSRYNLQITKPDQCVKYWIFIGDFEYMTGSSTVDTVVDAYQITDKLVTMQLQDVGALELEDSYSTSYSPVRESTRLYMAWLDDKGNYHAAHTVKLNQ